jgi:arsenate reductase
MANSGRIIMYTKPTCSTCRKADQILRESGEEYDKIEYYVTPLTADKIRELLRKMNMPASELIRKKEGIYKDLKLNEGNHSEDELIALMAKHPDLIQRPIVERGEKAVLARPVENIREIL